MTQGPSDPRRPEALLTVFAPRVYGLLYRLVGRPDVAEDLTQETMLRAYRGLRSYRPEGKFRAWLFRIAVNLARDWIRRQPRQASVSLEEGADPPVAAALGASAPPDSGVTRRERAARVEAGLARLSEADREVILLRYYGELAFKDIARATGEPIGTVLARAHRALRKLGDLIPEDEI
ncbi:MAG: sigma-70 family RNA polymerase sigma factor [Planctomycetes bacterium]|nr:sigma-70 family RNA polymerase sigma factor [Planctomycetota bacterium]